MSKLVRLREILPTVLKTIERRMFRKRHFANRVRGSDIKRFCRDSAGLTNRSRDDVLVWPNSFTGLFLKRH